MMGNQKSCCENGVYVVIYVFKIYNIMIRFRDRISVVGLQNGFRGQEVIWLGATVYRRDVKVGY